MKKVLVVMFVVATFITAGALAMSAAEKSTRVAEELSGSHGLSWNLNVPFSKVELTVSSPSGKVISKIFKSGVAGFDLSDLGENVLDGPYTYELRVTPRITEKSLKELNKRGEPLARAHVHTQTLTGYFTVSNGVIVNRNLVEPVAPKPQQTSAGNGDLSSAQDQQILDDLIVDGSICAGQDCNNGESFGFDTIRLKENNLRIRAMDTSNSASFPTRDWQITFNESDNGGANKFSIDDIDGGRTPFTIEAGAPSNSLYVDDGGRLGLGTSTPVVQLHVKDGNTPTLRLEQDGSSGFTPQTWDLAGNEANFFIRDATNGSGLPFRIFPGSGNDDAFSIAADGDIGIGTTSPATEAQFHVENTAGDDDDDVIISADGEVGIGTTAPTFPLEILTPDTINAAVVLTKTSGAGAKLLATSSSVQIGARTNHPLSFVINNNSTMMTLNTDESVTFANGASITTNGVMTDATSSRSLKKDIKNLSLKEAVDALMNLDPVKFRYKKDSSEAYVGFIADDVPELVATNGRKHINSIDIAAVLTRVVKEQHKTVKSQQETIAELKARLDKLEKQFKK